MIPELGGLFSKAIDWLVAALAALIATVWAALNVRLREIKKTADKAMPRIEWEQARQTFATERLMLLGDIKELFSRDDKLKDHINDKIDALRDDMHEQFQRLADKIGDR